MFPFRIALNSSTLRPFNLNVVEQLKIASEAGYEGIELWMADIMSYLENGGSTHALTEYMNDLGISCVNAIAFFRWSDRDGIQREAALDQARKEMEILADLGCPAVAAPPFGDLEGLTFREISGYFARLYEIGRVTGVEPYLEFWGKAAHLSRISEAILVLMESGVPNGKMLIDPFHMYTGGSSLDQLAYINGASVGIVHVNDYPDGFDRKTIMDKDRLFPGEGVMPSKKFAELLNGIGYSGFLSLELFIEHFGDQSALEVAQYGLNQIKTAYAL